MPKRLIESLVPGKLDESGLTPEAREELARWRMGLDDALASAAPPAPEIRMIGPTPAMEAWSRQFLAHPSFVDAKHSWYAKL